MKRWNEQGNVNTDYPVPPSALDYLAKRIGKLDLISYTAQETVLSAVTEPRLPTLPLVDLSTQERLSHARELSMHDRVDLRYGRENLIDMLNCSTACTRKCMPA